MAHVILALGVSPQIARPDRRVERPSRVQHDRGASQERLQRRDNRETLRADGPAELLDRIRADYAAHPVSRRIAGADRPETPGCRFLPEG